MPSVEIVCLKQKKPVPLSKYSFDAIADTALVSHRNPSRFQADFDKLDGVMYHLLTPGYIPGKSAPIAYGLFKNEIRKHNQTKIIKFNNDMKGEMKVFLNELLEASPIGKVVFTSDWQFGYKKGICSKELTIAEFWAQLETNKILFNSLYPIRKK